MSTAHGKSTASNGNTLPIAANAPTTVLSRTALVTLAGAAYGASYGVLKHHQPGAFAFRTGLNCFTFAFPFFALREYAVSPALGFFQGRIRSNAPQPPSNTLSLRTHNLAPSAISGAIVGGGLSTWAHGPNSLLRGMSTFGIVCLGLQYVANELGIARIKLIARYATKATDPSPVPAIPTSKPDTLSSDADRQQIQPFAASPTAAANGALESHDNPSSSSPSSTEEPSVLMSYLSSISPVRKVSDEEYAARLAAQREQAESRVHAIQQEAAELEAELGQQAGEGTSAATATSA
ncbi:unnamed protein product [Tilletia controversa]|uniref:Uncharacterized protein n=3 Tax=Tilletia TaxID=13289 RepID=A0A8X7MZQ4_9BASI|nr:hypothetical protein CF336_g6753 [Tilletia laevis]KAE8205813.1 hypothetical protein CF328_g270 [Tilletia controversa]KAE8262910.1 hypothetical protein A4X03_0g2084 [Tilletia caries]KAE8191450.1 hypothetical protein CF335_g6084 [Tilletia laevis]KAE8254653.1 hypothetical protein A4X06_0g796 [Tilletia controversa]